MSSALVMFQSGHAVVQIHAGFVHVLKTLEFQESDFKALKVLETGFWSLKALDFSLNWM